jgi:hypothetical protein
MPVDPIHAFIELIHIATGFTEADFFDTEGVNSILIFSGYYLE